MFNKSQQLKELEEVQFKKFSKIKNKLVQGLFNKFNNIKIKLLQSNKFKTIKMLVMKNRKNINLKFKNDYVL